MNDDEADVAPTRWADDIRALLVALPPVEAEAVSVYYQHDRKLSRVATQMSISMRDAQRLVAQGLRSVGRRLVARETETADLQPPEL